MKRVKKRIFAGAVCEQLCYNIRDNTDPRVSVPPRPRFADDAGRARHRDEIARRRFARRVNANFDTDSLYSTLTCDQEDELHDFPSAKRLLRCFIRRLKHAFPEAVIAAVMGRGKHTHRIHFHMLSAGIPEDSIRKQWIYGTVLRIEHLRAHNWYDGIDHGQDYTALANYLIAHWTPEQGGHRYFITRNAREPETEPAREVKTEYTAERTPRPPKGYILVEARKTTYGLIYYKYVVSPEKPTRTRAKRCERIANQNKKRRRRSVELSLVNV